MEELAYFLLLGTAIWFSIFWFSRDSQERQLPMSEQVKSGFALVAIGLFTLPLIGLVLAIPYILVVKGGLLGAVALVALGSAVFRLLDRRSGGD